MAISTSSRSPSAGLEPDQTEGDFGFAYAEIGLILALLAAGSDDEAVLAEGVAAEALAAVRQQVVARRRKRVAAGRAGRAACVPRSHGVHAPEALRTGTIGVARRWRREAAPR